MVVLHLLFSLLYCIHLFSLVESILKFFEKMAIFGISKELEILLALRLFLFESFDEICSFESFLVLWSSAVYRQSWPLSYIRKGSISYRERLFLLGACWEGRKALLG